MPRLVFHDHHNRERHVDIGPQRSRVTIGRNADCIIQTNNASVSREHAVVLFQSGSIFVQDPPSGSPTNGTYINGQRLRPGEVGRLNAGDELRCGKFAILLHADNGHDVGGPVPSSYGPPPSVGQRPQAPEPTWNPAMQPPQPTGYGVAPQVTTGVGGVSREDYEAVVRENIGLKTVEQRQREQIEQLQNQNLDKERLLADLERRGQQNENVVDGLNDKIDRLKEQIEQQKEQLRSLRDALKGSNEECEDLEFKLNELQRAMHARSDADADAESIIADLKVQINQRDRRVEDMQRELGLAQYALTTERENIERLELALRESNDQTGDFERYRKDMQRVVEAHEATIADLRRAIDDRDRDREKLIAQLDTLSASGSAEGELRARAGRLEEQLRQRDDEIKVLEQQLRDAERKAGQSLGGGGADPAELEAMRRRIFELEDELESAASSGGGDRRGLVQQLNQLKRENRDLRMQAGGEVPPSSGGGAGDPELQRRIVELEKELDETRQRMRDVQRSASSSVQGTELDELRRRAKTVYQAINDVVSAWRDDMQSMDLFIGDLQRMVEAFQRIDMNSLNTVDRVRLEGVIEEIDPKVTFEEIGVLISKNQSNAGSIKSSLRDLREVVL